MSRLLAQKLMQVNNSHYLLSFERKGDDVWPTWQRFISINGVPAYEIGNTCNTCFFYFEKIAGLNQQRQHHEVVESLNSGLAELTESAVAPLSKLIPSGSYHPILIRIFPRFVSPGTEGDYFANERKNLWMTWDYTFSPETIYYRGTDQVIRAEEKLFEFFIPLYSQSQLDSERVAFYEQQINAGSVPTALALSVLDVKGPAWIDEPVPEITAHWCLAHYIIDGNHKLYAAAKLGKSLTLLSFFALDEGIYESRNDVETLLQTL